MLQCKADASVFDRELRLCRGSPPEDAYLAAIGRVTNRVTDKVTECADQFVFRTEQVVITRRLQHDAMPAPAQRRRIGTQTRQQRRNTHAFIQRRAGCRLEGGKRQQILDNALHAPALLGHQVHVIARTLRIEFKLADGFQKPRQHSERRT